MALLALLTAVAALALALWAVFAIQGLATSVQALAEQLEDLDTELRG